MRSLVLFRVGPKWIEGSVRDQNPAVMNAHLVRMRDLYDKGVLLFAGPARKTHEAIALVEAESGAAAATIMDGDPAVQAGILTFRVLELSAYFDRFAGRAWPER